MCQKDTGHFSEWWETVEQGPREPGCREQSPGPTPGAECELGPTACTTLPGEPPLVTRAWMNSEWTCLFALLCPALNSWAEATDWIQPVHVIMATGKGKCVSLEFRQGVLRPCFSPTLTRGRIFPIWEVDIETLGITSPAQPLTHPHTPINISASGFLPSHDSFFSWKSRKVNRRLSYNRPDRHLTQYSRWRKRELNRWEIFRS